MSNRHESEDYYAILGVARSASIAEIRSAFRARAKELHPDTNRQGNTKEAFQRLQAAYAVLGRPEQRRRYDFTESVNPIDPPAGTPVGERAPPRRPWQKYRFAGLVIPVLALALIAYWVFALAASQPFGTPPTVTDLENEMEAAMARNARTLFGPPPEPTVVEVIGKAGRKYVVSGADSKRLVPIHDRLVTESKHLQQRRADLDARRAELEKEGLEVAAAKVAPPVEFRVKVDAFNRDGSILRRHFALHAAETEEYYKQVERLAVSDR